MFAADCPTKRAAFMTDMTPGRWSHVPANFQKWEEAQPKNLLAGHLKLSIFSALLSQSGITFGQLRLVQLHLNFPSSKDGESILRNEFHVGSSNFSCQV